MLADMTWCFLLDEVDLNERDGLTYLLILLMTGRDA